MPIVHGETPSKIRKRHPISLNTLEKEAARKVVLHEYKYAAHARERGGGGATEVALAPANQS